MTQDGVKTMRQNAWPLGANGTQAWTIEHATMFDFTSKCVQPVVVVEATKPPFVLTSTLSTSLCCLVFSTQVLPGDEASTAKAKTDFSQKNAILRGEIQMFQLSRGSSIGSSSSSSR